jgi:hypothetical protein
MFQEQEIYDDLKTKIRHLNEFVWEGKVDWPDVKNWLNNFNQGTDEHIQMLYLLSQFMYFGSREMRELLKSIYRDKYRYSVIERIRKQNSDTTDGVLINKLFSCELNKTRFLGVGNPSESGTHLLYYFRQETGLGKDLFINTHEITKRSGGKVTLRNPHISEYVFIDDLCGSGDQACAYSYDIVNEIKSLNPAATVSYYVLFAMKDGISKVKSDSSFDVVDCIYQFDDTFKCFGETSRHFKNVSSPIDKSRSKEISYKYGSQLLGVRNALGYKDCQLLVGFHHNTPDNTLPIIWYDEDSGLNWNAVFKRYNKKYGWGL